MKEEVVGKFFEGIKALVNDVYEGGSADGAAGKEASGISQEKYDADLAQAKLDGIAEGKASVVIPEGGTYSEEQYKALESELATAKEELATAKSEDAKTPHTAEEMAAAKSELELAKLEMEKLSSNDSAQEAAIAEGKSKIDAVLAILAPKQVEPELPVGEVVL